MDSFMKLDGSKSSSNGSGSDMDQLADMLRKNISVERPTVACSGESKYMTSLWVFENGDPCQQIHRSDSSQSTNSGFYPKGNTIDPHYQKKQERIKAVLKLLFFREQRVLVQFWSPQLVGKYQLLATMDQPFGLGARDEGLCSYRRDSECNPSVVEKGDDEEDTSPPARVFKRGLPEWTSDITTYSSTNFPRLECAIRCNLHGYLALPVFSSTVGPCVGVLELLMSSKYMNYTYEVQQVHKAMKTVDLITPQALHRPRLNVHNEHRQASMNSIFSNLKNMCITHTLPLAQTWAVSPLSSFASHKKVLLKSCNSFDTRCLEKVCMSTTGLPFHVQNFKMWPFWKACRERHVDRSRGYIGKALLIKGSCFCRDVTKLGDEDYPLVYNARMSRLNSCFAVFLHDVENNSDYVLELFLPDSNCVQDVVQTLKQKFDPTYGFELGDTSNIQVVTSSTDIRMLSTVTTKTTEDVVNMVTSDSESMVANDAKSDYTHVPNKVSSEPIYPVRTDQLVVDDVIRGDINVVGETKNDNTISYLSVSMQKPGETISDAAGENSNPLKKRRKSKIDSLTMEAVKQHFGVPIDQAAKTLGVSRTTLQHFCRDNDITSWPFPKYKQKPDSLKQIQNPLLIENLQHFSIKHASQNLDDSALSDPTLFLKYTTNNNAKVSDTGIVTVKASFEKDIIKFPFLISLGLAELKKQVAQRIELDSATFHIKYKDEDDDMITLALDADLQSLLGFSTDNSTIKLLIEKV
ncbi:protein NLP3-like [Rutidosis leptorrhynchoides]|uniref:protein NLP3-like n=1 Tax=Rutidosis leptorrhynchoides TaxID=125765 RepID=UPI003A9A60F0